mmetsp:Transcript_19327/g.36485  ORF Transcript_19327/g.36485 Transcript_19327/m.36485 type:complete len:80 (+) Transcript_19327:356-595(+)
MWLGRTHRCEVLRKHLHIDFQGNKIADVFVLVVRSVVSSFPIFRDVWPSLHIYIHVGVEQHLSAKRQMGVGGIGSQSSL